MNCLKKKFTVAIDIYNGKVDVYYLSINHRFFFYPRNKKKNGGQYKKCFYINRSIIELN